ncbi:transposase [uncultured Intestinimonas sp.]|uniref:RNA-guided endonuclease InsQ/TnpB family protein n=1 Tax=uncultured Intestinimonas sp. TaxID=1689265 RepID=UPI002600062B|nr:transposase [uncultured Intestinimonas sp.]
MGSKRGADGKQSKSSIQYNTIKVPLYPTPEQEALFQKTFGCCRYIWNRMLADHEEFYYATDKHFIPTPAKYKKEVPFLREVDNQALIQEHNKLSQAFRNFFRNPAAFGYPRFKRKKDGRDRFTACNHVMGESATIYITQNAVRMTKAGLVRAKFPRRPRSGWRLTRITVERTKTGRYYGCLLFACPVHKPEPVEPTAERTIGLKYSVTHFYVTDGGAAADPPRWLKQSQEKLAAIQQKLSRLQPGSRNYQEQVQTYRLLHERIANQRRDFLHKESRRIANAWDAVCIRGDSLRAISGALGGGEVLHSGFGMFREMLRYKLERQGKQLLEVDRFVPTTKVCSACGAVTESIPPKAQRWICPVCGAEHRRGVNAAVNIKAKGLVQYQAGQVQEAVS